MRTRAIILKKQNTNEYDQLVTFYSEEFGKVTGVAKSILKPSSIQAMHLDLFNLVDLELISGRAVPIITGAQAEEVYGNIKNDLPSLAAAYFFAETADRLFFDYQKDEELWDFFISFLGELNEGPRDKREFLESKQVEFLNILGYAPNLEECTFCAANLNGNLTAYSVEAKGAICQNCFFAGHRGIVVKNGKWEPRAFIGHIFEGLSEKKLHSLNLMNSVLKLRE